MRFVLAILLLAAWPSSAFAGQSGQASPQAATAQKVILALEQSGLTYRKATDNTWAVPFEADGNSSSFEVMISAQKSLVLVLVVVQRRSTPTPAQLTGLLRVNYDVNYSKVGVDGDGDLLALDEIRPDGLTGTALRVAIHNVAATARAAAKVFEVSAGTAATAARSEPPANPSLGGRATLSLVRGAFELSYDPRKWRPSERNEGIAIQLNHVSGEVYVRVISERVQIESDALRDVALTNARTIAPDVQLDSETWRTENGLRTLLVKYTGRASGVRFTFLNQMYSDTSGTVQLAGWTGSNLFEEFRNDFLELFSGFRKTP
jgi:hypothetical protein